MKGLSRKVLALVGAAGLALGVAACGGDDDNGGGGTGGDESVTLRLGYVTTPQHPYGLAVDAFAKQVGEASGGKITVSTVPNYTGGDSQLFDDVVGGTVEMGGISTAIWDVKGSNVFQALQAPFLITNYGHSQAILGGKVGRAMLDSPNGPAKFGLVGLGLLEGGLRKPLGRSEALKTPADFAGKKIRAPQSKVLAATITALGAEPVALPVGDVFTALQNGTVDGMEANLGLIFTNKYHEVAKFVTQDVNLWPFPAAVVINKAQWDKLSDEQKGWFREAGENLFPETTIAAFVSPPAGAINFVKELCDAGLTYAFAGDAGRAALEKAAQPAIEQLSADPEVAGFIKQIQDAKATAPAPPAPPPLPAGCKKA